MLRVGLTGGMGCGKSTVAGMMREFACRVFDADIASRELVAPGEPALAEIARAFGSEVLDSHGALDRGRLAHIVFNDADARPGRSKLSMLNAILHPRVIARQEAWLDQLARTEPRAVAVVEAALLIEAGAHKSLDRVIVVFCEKHQQLDRLIAESRRQISREQAEARIAAQMPLAEKLRLATDTIDNSGSIEQTRAQVSALVARLKSLAAQPAKQGSKP